MLQSFPENYRAVVFGASGGVGGAIVQALLKDDRCARVFAGSRSGDVPEHQKVSSFSFDLTDEASLSAAAELTGGPVHLAFVATGILHSHDISPERSWKELSAEAMQTVFSLNTFGPALIAKHFLPLLPRDERSVFAALSARVGSIGDNHLGGWHSYRASKAALNMLVRNFAIELARKNKQAACICLHPGTVDSALSQPFQRGVPPGKLFTPEYSAEQLLSVIDTVTPEQSGTAFSWDGQIIEW